MPRISKATEYNWKKLNSDSKDKLTKRANKTQSKKRIIATNYLDDSKANTLLKIVLEVDSSVENIMYTLACSALSQKGLLQKQHVQNFLQKYSHFESYFYYSHFYCLFLNKYYLLIIYCSHDNENHNSHH